MNEINLSEEDMQSLYAWVDEVPLSRPKKNISRDFADGGTALIVISLINVSFFTSFLCVNLAFIPKSTFFSSNGRDSKTFFP